MLTELGGIESEATVTRLGENRFYLLSSAVAETHDLDWLTQHIAEGEDVTVANVTNEYGMLALAGPRSRDVLGKLTDADLSNEGFRWLSGQEITVAGVPTRALRVSYVGELGWELHHPMASMETLYDALMDAGKDFGIANFGVYAVNSLRMEKAYKGWGSELTTEITPIEARLERFVDFSKPFSGRKAVQSRKLLGHTMELVYAEVDADDADCLGNEPCLDGERIMGVTTSGAFGHTVGKSLVFAYVEPRFASPGSQFGIDVLGARRTATVLAECAYDPNNKRLRDI